MLILDRNYTPFRKTKKDLNYTLHYIVHLCYFLWKISRLLLFFWIKKESGLYSREIITLTYVKIIPKKKTYLKILKTNTWCIAMPVYSIIDAQPRLGFDHVVFLFIRFCFAYVTYWTPTCLTTFYTRIQKIALYKGRAQFWSLFFCFIDARSYCCVWWKHI